VHAENSLAAPEVWRINDDLTVESTRTEERWIEHVGSVCGSDQNDTIIRLETVHLDEQLIERLLTLIVPATEACSTMPPNRIDFIDEDDTRRMGLALFEQISDAAGANTNEHLDEIRTRHREEGAARFSGDGLR